MEEELAESQTVFSACLADSAGFIGFSVILSRLGLFPVQSSYVIGCCFTFIA